MRARIALLVTALGCSNGGFQPGDGGAPGDASVSADVQLSIDGGDEGPCALSCSADLHYVVDCRGNAVVTCPSDQGCGKGNTCEPACDAARDNGSTQGCEFYAVDVAGDGESAGSCFAAYVTNSWNVPVSVDVTYQGKTLDLSGAIRLPVPQVNGTIFYDTLPNGQIPPGKVAVLFLADDPAISPSLPTRCPAGVKAAWYGDPDPASTDTTILSAFRIHTSAPAVAYDIYPYGGSLSYTTSATLLLPTSAWGQNYVLIDAFAKGQTGPLAQPWMQIVASQDDTHVTIVPTANVVGGASISPVAANTAATYTLNAGEVLQLKQDTELNGTPVQSDKPVAAFGGNGCMTIDLKDSACDSGHQQLFPTQALGSEYVAARHRDRVAKLVESPPWRIMGVVDGTTLTYDPQKPAGAPDTLARGEVVMFSTPDDFVVRSQDDLHPFYLGGHMTGQKSQGQDFGTGDPEWVNTIPPKQFLDQYAFMTDPTMANTSIVVVRTRAADGTMKPVALDCWSNIGGFKAVDGADQFEAARFDLMVDGTPTKTCKNGPHTIKSDGPFGVTVWGWDRYVSYAYPAGASARPINSVVVPATPK